MTKLGPAYRWGEPTEAVTIRVPKSTLDRVPGDQIGEKRDRLVQDAIKKYGQDKPKKGKLS